MSTQTSVLRKKRNFKALQLPSEPSPQDPSSSQVQSTSQQTGIRSAISTTIAGLNAPPAEGNSKPNHRLGPLKNQDFRNIQELGLGNGGSVVKVEHLPSGLIMAKKVRSIHYLSPGTISRPPLQIVLIDAKPTVRKQILRELHIMHDCNSPYIVTSFGAYLTEPNICICMEYMDKGVKRFVALLLS